MILCIRPVFAAVFAVLISDAAFAAPEQSPRPMPRQTPLAETGTQPRQAAVPVRFDATIRPRPRPVRGSNVAGPVLADEVMTVLTGPGGRSLRPRPRPVRAAQPAKVVEVFTSQGTGRSIRPEPRPATKRRATGVTRVATGRSEVPPKATGKSGRLCGDKGIRGETLSRIPGKIPGCGVAKPVRVTAIDGVALSRPATMDCDTARALQSWVRNGVKPAVGRLGGGVKSMRVVASYSCRTRNNRPGAKISEHGKGKAVDIAAINLNNGVALTILKGWRDPVQGKLLKRMHKSACGPFGTVLGPNSDKYHQDHFHLDTASYRSGPYCR